MSTTIYFAETKDFKLLKSRLTDTEGEFRVYLYADTSNVKIPKDIIKSLPKIGNYLVWEDIAGFDSSQLVNHIVFMIGQYMMLEEQFEFFIATKTQRYAKTVELLQREGVLIDVIAPEEPTSQPAKKRRGRPPKAKIAQEETAQPKRGRGRPRKNPVIEPAVIETPKKKRGRPKKQAEEPKKTKSAKSRKPRTEKEITNAEVKAKLAAFPSTDADVEQIQKVLFGLGKVKRPKIDQKLGDLIKTRLGIGDNEAMSLVDKLKATGMMDNSGKGDRIRYKD